MRRFLLSLLLGLASAGCTTVALSDRTARERDAATLAAKKRDLTQPLPAGLYAEISTSHGIITAELFFEKMPLTVASFVGLAEGALGPAPRKPFFNGLTFHRVVPDFVIQGGDPTGTGRGDAAYRFPDEFAAGLRHDRPGRLSMANSGPDSNGSQFFITLGAARYLDFVHGIFGEVIRGGEIPARISRGATMEVRIIRVGRTARDFRTDEKTFQERLARAPRWQPPYFEDRTRLNAGPAAWQAKYLEMRLANLARFTSRQIFVRLADHFDSEDSANTPAEATEQLRTRFNIPPGAILACYALNDDRWLISGGPAGLKGPPAQAAGPDGAAGSRQNQLYTTVGEVVSSLIDQTDSP